MTGQRPPCTASTDTFRAHATERYMVDGLERCSACEAAPVVPAGGRDASRDQRHGPASWTSEQVELDTSSRDPGDAGQLVIDPSVAANFATAEAEVELRQLVVTWRRASRRAALEGGHRT